MLELKQINRGENQHIWGNKALGLSWLQKKGFRVPLTYVLESNLEISKSNLQEIASRFNTKNIIVRSSSNLEDTTSKSFAGLFLSKSTDIDNLMEAINEVRSHALNNHGITSIPILIQPLIEGVGGVYLNDGKVEKLTVAAGGPDQVTSGKLMEIEKVDSDSWEYRESLKLCRKIYNKFRRPVDIEFIIENECIYILQCRPLVEGFVFVEQINEHFPEKLNKLCGSIWLNCLTKCLNQKVEYLAGYIIIDKTPLVEEKDIENELEPYIYEQTLRFYREELFPAWEASLVSIKKKLCDEPKIQINWHFIYDQWLSFYSSYFTNKYEYAVNHARNLRLQGIASCPSIIAWLTALNTGNKDFFLHEYGDYFVNPTVFSDPTFRENPILVEDLLKSRYTLSIPKRLENPSIELQVAWLAEDDNKYKHLFNSLLRQSILALSRRLTDLKILNNVNDIWDLKIEEVNHILKTGSSITPEKPNRVTTNSKVASSTRYIRKIYGGDVEGIITRNTQDNPKGKILVKSILSYVDYSFFMNCEGAIVSICDDNSHTALLARDLNKPLYQMTSANISLVEGQKISIRHSQLHII